MTVCVKANLRLLEVEPSVVLFWGYIYWEAQRLVIIGGHLTTLISILSRTGPKGVNIPGPENKYWDGRSVSNYICTRFGAGAQAREG